MNHIFVYCQRFLGVWIDPTLPPRRTSCTYPTPSSSQRFVNTTWVLPLFNPEFRLRQCLGLPPLPRLNQSSPLLRKQQEVVILSFELLLRGKHINHDAEMLELNKRVDGSEQL